jgi:hypothetical protein
MCEPMKPLPPRTSACLFFSKIESVFVMAFCVGRGMYGG